MKILAIVALSVFIASCSYEFSQPPFQKDELTEITKSEFGKELLSHIENFPDIEQAGNPENNLTKDTWVYVVADDFLIQQNEKDESPGWELTVWTKNRHHIISCSLMQDENFEIDNVNAKTKEDGTIYLEGRTEELKHLAVQLSLTAPKLCVVFPYANASDVIDSTTEYIDRIDRLTTELDVAATNKTEYESRIDQLTTELDVAATNKTEYESRIDQLTTELDVATNAMLGEQEKAQKLQKLNQELDEELSSSKTRSLLLLVIGGIAAIGIIIIAVRSRLKKAGR